MPLKIIGDQTSFNNGRLLKVESSLILLKSKDLKLFYKMKLIFIILKEKFISLVFNSYDLL